MSDLSFAIESLKSVLTIERLWLERAIMKQVWQDEETVQTRIDQLEEAITILEREQNK